MFTNYTALIKVCIQTVRAFIHSKKEKRKEKEDFHAERMLFIAPYSVCSIRKVKIHDFYFQGSSKQTVVWMYY